MKVLAITGDLSFKKGHPRFDLQSTVVELEALYWGGTALWPRVRGASFDVVTSQDPFFRGLVGLCLARHFKARLNVQVHADFDAQSFVKRSIARIVLRHAHSIRAVSERIKNQIERLGVSAPVSVLPVFVDTALFQNLQRRPQPRKTILWIGRFEQEKDPLRAIDVLKQVRARGVDAQLVMAGAGSMEGEIARYAVGIPVVFAGWQTNLVPELEKADVVLSTSRAESWGASIVEALAAGVPVVAPDVGIAKEAGALVVPRAELAETVVAVLQDATARGKLAITMFSREEWLQRWRDTLEGNLRA